MDQAAVGGVRGPADGNDAQKIDHSAGSTDPGRGTAEGDEESAGGKHPGGRDETADNLGDAAAGGAHLGREKFRQVEREPTEEQCGHEALGKDRRQESRGQWTGPQEEHPGQDR